jgi:hypothetical protein
MESPRGSQRRCSAEEPLPMSASAQSRNAAIELDTNPH